MKEGDILTCKKDFYSDSGSTFIKKLFRIPLFQKGKGYKIDKIITKQQYIYPILIVPFMQGPQGPQGPQTQIYQGPQVPILTTSTTTLVTSTTSTTRPVNCTIINVRDYIISDMWFSEEQIMNIFFTIKEERNLKLKKLKKIIENDI